MSKKKIGFSQKAKEAITNYKVKNMCKENFSLVECRILTGRTHQIRVHMLSKGCPIVGDKLYSAGRNFSKNLSRRVKSLISNLDSQALHATELTFYHPIKNNLLKFSAEKPKEFLQLEQVLFEHM